MLDLIRKKQKTVIVKVVFWVIIAAFIGTIFLVWGRGSDRGGKSGAAAKVNGETITFDEYRTTYNNLYRTYQNMYREKFTPELERQLGLEQQALDSLIEQRLLLQEADRRDIDVPRKELVEAIAAEPAFQNNGSFDKNRYLQVLDYQRLTPEDYERMMRRQLRIEKVREQIQSGVAVTPEDIEQEYRDRNEKVNLTFVRLTPELFEDDVDVDAKALQAYFDEHREQFRIPAKVALRYLEFEPARYEDEVTFEEKDLERYYRRHLDRFEIKEQVKASHILIRVDQDADEAKRQKKRELAAEVLEKVEAGKDFDDLARRYSDDTASATKGGELGYFTRGTMVAPFEDAAFSLEPGQVSDLVETPFGFHIIKVEGYIEPGVEPMAEVIDEVKAGLRTEKARDLAFEKAMDAYNMHRKDADLEAAAQANDLGVKETGFFSREEAIDGLGREPELNTAAFTLEEGQLARPFRLPDSILLFGLKERRESRLPELEEVRQEVEQAYRRDKAKELARKAAQEMLAALRDGRPLSELAGEQGVEVEETGPFSRSYGAFVPRLGSVEDLPEDAFSLTEEQPVPEQIYSLDGKFVVVQLKERLEADPQGLDDAKRQELREALVTRKKDRALANKVEELRQTAEITIAPSLLNTLEGN